MGSGLRPLVAMEPQHAGKARCYNRSPLEPEHVTTLLARAAEGDAAAEGDLLNALYGELHRLARAHMDRQDPRHTLQVTALLHEAWLRIDLGRGESWSGREHFLCFASRAMRSVLVDHARRQSRRKRAADGERLPLDVVLQSLGENAPDVVALDDVLSALGRRSPELEQLVNLRFFGGLSMPEAARVLGRSVSGVERDWRVARTWLREALSRDD